MTEQTQLLPDRDQSLQQQRFVMNGNAPTASIGFFERTVRPCLAEFVGVTLFVFIGTMSVSSSSASGLVGVALGHGLTIALLVTATGSISGGHLNPAVTVGVLFAREITLLNALLYLISQLLGAILGTALTKGVLSGSAFSGINGGITAPGPDVSNGEAMLCEVLLTSLLVLTVLLTAVDPNTKSALAPIAIGLAVIVCILAGGPVSGASMNPARSFGPAVVASNLIGSAWRSHWIYWVGPILGALLAATIHRTILAGPEKRIILKPNH